MPQLRVALGLVAAPLAAAAASMFVQLANDVINGRSLPDLGTLAGVAVFLSIVCFVVGVPILLALQSFKVRSAIAFLLCAIGLAAASSVFMQVFSEILSHGHAVTSSLLSMFVLAGVATIVGFGVFWLIAVRSPNPTVDPTRANDGARGSP